MDRISNILQEIWTRRIVRFILVGVLMTLINVLLISILVGIFNLNTPLLRSLGNAFATEICLLLSFFCYRQFVWESAQIEWQDVYLRELPKYHLSVASVIAIRVLLLFPLLDWIGIHYTLNTMIGIALGAILSYSLSDKFVFNVPR
ncbi:GtrA family protein [Pseudanabaena biceps]|nr:GtrA family protein [Pseudanabaena biceps]